MDLNTFVEPIQHAPSHLADFVGNFFPDLGHKPSVTPEPEHVSTILGS